MDFNEILLLEAWTDKIKREKLPIIIYGTGDGADKIIAYLQSKNLFVSDVFASDGFVRNRIYQGMQVLSIEEVTKKYAKSGFCIVSAFALEGEKANLFYKMRSEYTLYCPNLPPFGTLCADKKFITEMLTKIEHAYNLLADEKSREIFVSLLKYDITADIKYLCNEYFDMPDEWYNHKKTHIDIGAYNGDTVLEYVKKSSDYSGIIAVEPDCATFEKLKINTKGCKNITLINAAAWKCDGTAFFDSKGSRASRIIDSDFKNNCCINPYNNTKIDLRSIDSICGKKYTNSLGIDVGSIKIDGEGADAEILYGAANVIYSQLPIISVAVYHRASDFFEFPIYLSRQNPKYKFFLRQKKYIPSFDVFLIAK
ncbi:MAG: FkbM family methyltransferase [Clostridia bacterium]